MNSRNFTVKKIPLDEAGNKADLGMSGHAFKVIDAPPGVKITIWMNNAGSNAQGIELQRGGGWRHMAFSKLYGSWDAAPGQSVLIGCFGETTDENKALTEILEGAAAGTTEITNTADNPANVILRNTDGSINGGPEYNLETYNNPDDVNTEKSAMAPGSVALARDNSGRYSEHFLPLELDARFPALKVKEAGDVMGADGFSINPLVRATGPRLLAVGTANFAEPAPGYPFSGGGAAGPSTSGTIVFYVPLTQTIDGNEKNTAGFLLDFFRLNMSAAALTLPAVNDVLIKICDDDGNVKHHWTIKAQADIADMDLLNRGGPCVIEMGPLWYVEVVVDGTYGTACLSVAGRIITEF